MGLISYVKMFIQLIPSHIPIFSYSYFRLEHYEILENMTYFGWVFAVLSFHI